MFTMRLELKTMLRFPSEVKSISKTLFQSKKKYFLSDQKNSSYNTPRHQKDSLETPKNDNICVACQTQELPINSPQHSHLIL